VIEGLNIDRAILVGWSMGGRVAANYLHTHGAGRVGGVNFVSSTAFVNATMNVRGPDAGMAQETVSPVREEFIRGTARFIRSCTSVPMHGEEFEMMYGAAMAVPLPARKGSFMWHVEYPESMRDIDIPVLATHGLGDRFCSSAAAHAIAARLQRVALSLIPEVGPHAILGECAKIQSRVERFRGPLLRVEPNECRESAEWMKTKGL
jgi:pimeloyl-ACP methyl ester carboxylesterase